MRAVAQVPGGVATYPDNLIYYSEPYSGTHRTFLSVAPVAPGACVAPGQLVGGKAAAALQVYPGVKPLLPGGVKGGGDM